MKEHELFDGVSLIPITVEDNYGLVESIYVRTPSMSFSVELSRGMDISNFFYKGVKISYDSPSGVCAPESFIYGKTNFNEHMFYGLLTTCGLENIGPESFDINGKYYSRHGSQNYERATDITVENLIHEKKIKIKGTISSKRYHMHSFIVNRTITIDFDNDAIEINDYIKNIGELQQICLMYHVNFGSPFLSPESIIKLPKVNIVPRDEVSKKGLKNLKFISNPKEEALPQLFYLKYDQDCCKYASLVNPSYGIEAKLEFFGMNKMDIWKSFKNKLYVLSFEPCNSYPYGKQKQIDKNEAVYLKTNEANEYGIKISFRRYKSEEET